MFCNSLAKAKNYEQKIALPKYVTELVIIIFSILPVVVAGINVTGYDMITMPLPPMAPVQSISEVPQPPAPPPAVTISNN
jgi:hypothetical protein